MKPLISILCMASLCILAAGQQQPMPQQPHAAMLMRGLGDLHHPVFTANPQAQQFFDQGLRLIFAFNHDEAARSFKRAAELDPKLAMAYWGIAEAIGPNYNDPASEERFRQAHEAIMDLHPWGLWHLDGTAEAGTDEIIATLESVVKRDPNHLGAVHYYIHAVEASPSPERALAGANRLAALAPAAGHIVHMPAHIYIRTGDYQAAVKTNQEAAAVDRAYIKTSGVQGIYPAMYYSHNLHFIAATASMNGDYAEAMKAANMLAAHVDPMVKDMPPLEAFMLIPMAVNVRFQRWDEILKTPPAAAERKITTTYRYFARGMALAAKGKIAEAEAERQALVAVEDATPPDAVFSIPFNNKTKNILKIASNVLGAKIALAKKDNAEAIARLREAVAIQDSLNYGEPPDWFSPVRERLGAVLLMSGNNAEAEKVFREDLDRNPRNPRSLFGLQQALKAQGRTYDAQFVERQFRSSWKGPTPGMKVEDLV